MFEWIVGVIAAAGLIGVFLLMFGENIVPPIPSEVVMPLAGFAAAQGALSLPGVVVAGTLGAVAGAYVWYVVGLKLREERLRGWIDRYGRWLTVDQEDLDRSQRFFARWGGWAVFIGRLIPGVRTFISVPAGVMRMPPPAFVAWTTLGTAIWTLFLAAAGYLLAHEYHRVAEWIDPITEIVLGIVVIAYVWRVIRFRRGRR